LDARLAQRLFVRRRYLLPALLALTCLSSAQAGLAATPAAATPRVAEAGMPVLESYSVKDFSTGSQFWSILQDRRGVMYFGASAGIILEYDGVSWRKIFLPTDAVRSLAVDENNRIWVGGEPNFGYLTPDAAGTLHFVSLVDQIPVDDRNFTSVWQTVVTPQGIFFRAYEHLFRWDGKQMHVWSPEANSKFQGISAIRGHIYVAQDGVGLQEIVGDELRNLPGGNVYRGALKVFIYPFDDTHILVSH
jgi:hypothetical protein